MKITAPHHSTDPYAYIVHVDGKPTNMNIMRNGQEARHYLAVDYIFCFSRNNKTDIHNVIKTLLTACDKIETISTPKAFQNREWCVEINNEVTDLYIMEANFEDRFLLFHNDRYLFGHCSLPAIRLTLQRVINHN